MRQLKSRKLNLLTLAAALLFVSTPAMADLSSGSCESTADLVAADIVELAEDTRVAGMSGIWMRRGHIDPYAGERFARKLDADPKKLGKPRRGAATQLLQGKVENALSSIDGYIAGVEKTAVTDDEGQYIADMLVEDAIFLIDCINSL